jgi:signal transduction histidine kinase
MKPPPPDRADFLPRAVLVVERWVRTHPVAVGLFTVGSVAAIGLGQIYMSASGPTPLTYAFPLAICTYGLGLLAGVATATVIGILWLLDAMSHGLPQREANFVFALRLFSNLVIVALAALASAAARARERYLDGQAQLAQLRADLVSAFSHDLRSPLAAITGYTDMVLDGTQDAETREILARVLANAHHLDRLIGDMLSAGAGNATAPLQVTTFTPEALIDELRAEFSATPPNEGIALVWEIEPQTAALQTDRTKLTSVVRNLVTNALKFTDSGQVVVHLGAAPASGLHCLEVKDTGAGIPAEAVPHVFDRFYRVPGVRSGRGFGLGLFIVKRFTELLGGEVSVRSQLGRGTCFTVTIPHLPSQRSQADAPNSG